MQNILVTYDGRRRIIYLYMHAGYLTVKLKGQPKARGVIETTRQYFSIGQYGAKYSHKLLK